MTYMSIMAAKLQNVSYIYMINKAGNIVQPSTDAVEQAMEDFKHSISPTDLSVNIVDGPGANSWPISMVSYITIFRDINKTDCTVIEELLTWISWVQLNDQAMMAASNTGHVPLTSGWKRRLIDSLGTVTCGGKEAFSSAVLIGVGGDYPAYQEWASSYASTKFKLKYFSDSNSINATQQMIKGTLHF